MDEASSQRHTYSRFWWLKYALGYVWFSLLLYIIRRQSGQHAFEIVLPIFVVGVGGWLSFEWVSQLLAPREIRTDGAMVVLRWRHRVERIPANEVKMQETWTDTLRSNPGFHLRYGRGSAAVFCTISDYERLKESLAGIGVSRPST